MPNITINPGTAGSVVPLSAVLEGGTFRREVHDGKDYLKSTGGKQYVLQGAAFAAVDPAFRTASRSSRRR